MTPPTRSPRFELGVAAFGLIALFSAQWMLSRAIHGTNYTSHDGKMAQAITLAAVKFAEVLHVTNLSPIMGVGSQMLPKNVWINPSFWPFALLDPQLATDVSALIALAAFAIGCYAMARCFDLSVVSSVVAAQSCILSFAPTLVLLSMPANFALTPADAVVYAAYMPVLGLLARLEGTSSRALALTTGGIFALLFYSIGGDPLFTFVAAVGWATAYVVVIVGSLRAKAILARCAVLGACFGLFLVSGVVSYLYTMSRYTSRVQFPAVGDRPHWVVFVSAATYSPNMKYFYLACFVGWLLGLLLLRGRTRLLAVAATASFCVYLVYTAVFLLLNAPWTPPIPIYMEQCLVPLYSTAAIAGYWSALRAASNLARWVPWPLRFARWVVAGLTVAVIPLTMAHYALYRAAPLAETWNQAWPDEPEVMRFFEDTIGQTPGRPFRGSAHFYTVNDQTQDTISALWAGGIATLAEYSQLVSPQALYFEHAVIQQDVRGHLNGFGPYFGLDQARFWNALQLFGARYYVTADTTANGAAVLRDLAHRTGFPSIALPRRAPGTPPGHWHIHTLPHPNVGDYNPTDVTHAETADQIAAKLREPGFDFRRQAVVSPAIDGPLVPARDLRMSRGRGRLHVSGHSDGTSLVVLPQQFSHCLRALDRRVRLVRADLMLTGVVFSGALDTDIVLDFGFFTPRCRWADLADLKGLDFKIDVRTQFLRPGPLFPDWRQAIATLRAAAGQIR
jgi:hypothetical protein